MAVTFNELLEGTNLSEEARSSIQEAWESRLDEARTEMTAELRHRVQIRSLGGRRQVAERHVVDHAATKGAHRLGCGHRELLLGWVASTPKPSSRSLPSQTPQISRVSGFVQSPASQRSRPLVSQPSSKPSEHQRRLD